MRVPVNVYAPFGGVIHAGAYGPFLLRDIVPDFRKQKIEVKAFVNNEPTVAANEEVKRSALDVVAELNDERHADIEMQCLWHEGLLVRVLLYVCHLFTSLVKRGTPSKDIKPVYLILFTRFTLFPTLKKICNAFGFRADDDNKVLFTDKMRIVTVELDKLDPSKPIEELDNAEQWCYLIDKGHEAKESDMNKLAQTRPEMDEAVRHATSISEEGRLQLLAATEDRDRMIAFEIRESHEETVKKIKAEQQRLDEDQQRFDKAKQHFDEDQQRFDKAKQHFDEDQQRFKQRIEEGREQGRQEGRQEGELQSMQMIARRMLQANKSTAEICELTGLSKSAVAKLS